MKDDKRVIRSQYKCGRCGDVVASFHRHDMRSCCCGALAIDGGTDYTRLVLGKGIGLEEHVCCSILVPADTSTEDCRFILGVLCALEFETRTCFEALGAALVVQHSKKPWFPVPESSIELTRALELLVELGYVEEDREGPTGHCYRRVVELAPWPSDEDWH